MLSTAEASFLNAGLKRSIRDKSSYSHHHQNQNLVNQIVNVGISCEVVKSSRSLTNVSTESINTNSNTSNYDLNTNTSVSDSDHDVAEIISNLSESIHIDCEIQSLPHAMISAVSESCLEMQIRNHVLNRQFIMNLVKEMARELNYLKRNSDSQPESDSVSSVSNSSTNGNLLIKLLSMLKDLHTYGYILSITVDIEILCQGSNTSSLIDVVTRKIRDALIDLEFPRVRVEGGRSEDSGEKLATRIVSLPPHNQMLFFPSQSIINALPQALTLGILSDQNG